jgi:CheY-like chemotaxis protein
MPPAGRLTPTVLVVEDDRDCRDMLCTWLRSNGYEAVPAGDGRQALERLEERADVDLILLDLMMPGMSGWQFRSSQRIAAPIRKIPVVVMTAHPNPDGEAEWLDPEDVLLKPLDLRQVLHVVSRCCGPAPAPPTSTAGIKGEGAGDSAGPSTGARGNT